VLRNLAGVNEIRKYMVSDAGAVLVSLAHSATTTQIQATELFLGGNGGSIAD
jgi:hypothetical protein